MSEETFGNKLRSAREDCNLSIRDVAEILRVDQELLRALERNDFDALPDEDVMNDYLHRYAECLQVDADLMIADYEQDRDKNLRKRASVAEATRRPRSSSRLAALAILAIVILATWWVLSRDATAPAPERSVTTASVEHPPPVSKTTADIAPGELPAAVEQTRADVAPGQRPADVAPEQRPADVAPEQLTADVAPAPAAPAPSVLNISEYGVGTAVENLQLLGRSDRFTAGTRVWFWTRVRGGTPGDRIDHVWLLEGVEVARRSMEIGGPVWRTYSSKTVAVGATGNWVAEARDAAGRVLARSEFVCVP